MKIKRILETILISSAFLFPLKISSEEINKKHEIRWEFPYKEKRMLETKITCEKQNDSYSLQVFVYCPEWQSRKEKEYFIFDSVGSSIFLVYPKEAAVEEIKEKVYARKGFGKNISQEWIDFSLEAYEKKEELRDKIIEEVLKLPGGDLIKEIKDWVYTQQAKSDQKFLEKTQNYVLKKIPLCKSGEYSAVQLNATLKNFDKSFYVGAYLVIKKRNMTSHIGRLEDLLIEVQIDSNTEATKEIQLSNEAIFDDIKGEKMAARNYVRYAGFKTPMKDIEIKKGEGKFTIPFGKIKSIEFLTEEKNNCREIKICCIDGKEITGEYLSGYDSWGGETDFGGYVIRAEKIKKIEFLRGENKNLEKKSIDYINLEEIIKNPANYLDKNIKVNGFVVQMVPSSELPPQDWMPPVDFEEIILYIDSNKDLHDNSPYIPACLKKGNREIYKKLKGFWDDNSKEVSVEGFLDSKDGKFYLKKISNGGKTLTFP